MLIPLYTNWYLCREQEPVEPAFPDAVEFARIKNRLARWFSIYFPEYKDVYGDLKAVSRRMVLKAAPLPEYIRKHEAKGVNQIWRDAKLRGAGMKRAKTLVLGAEHSVGSKGHRKQHGSS